MVAGSTDSRDEQLLINTFATVSKANVDTRLLLVPHESSQQRMAEVKNIAHRVGVPIEIWSTEAHEPSGKCVVVDKVGILADIYALAQVAYVGGGFRRGGLHAVAEAAVFGIPIVVGPHYGCSADAKLVLDAAGGRSLTEHAPERKMFGLWDSWLAQEDDRTSAGLKARSVLQQGASDTTASVLLGLLDSGPQVTPDR